MNGELSIHEDKSPEIHVSDWQCTKCDAVFPQKNIARLHLRVRHTFKLFASRAETIERSIISAPRNAACGVYEYTSDVIAGKAYALGRLQENIASSSYQVLEALINDSDSPSTSPTVEHLVRAARHRRSVLRLASTLGDTDPELMAALTRDEEHIMRLLKPMSDADRNDIMRLRGSSAADLLNLLDLILRPLPPTASDVLPFKAGLSGYDVELERSMQRAFVRLCESSLQLPHRLWLSGVYVRDHQPVDGGSYGEIYKGEYGGKLVALKSLRIFRNREEDMRNKKAFHREIALVRGIVHRHVCQIIGVDRESFTGLTCVVLPWMSYGNALQYIAKVGWFAQDAIRLICQVVSGLAYLHRKSVVHGDLHVGNILVDAARDVQLVDFGLSNFSDSALSCSSAQPGATRCMAPEIFDPVRFLLPRVQHTPASDMYSFGQVTWQIYTGKIPFPDLTNYQAMFAILDGKSQQRSLSGREIPDALWEIMLACWRLEPPRRADALTVLRQLEAVNLAGQLGQQSPSRSDANISADAQTSSELTPTPSDVIVPNKALPPPSNNPTTYIASSPPPSSISTLDTSQKLDAVVKAASNITLEDGSLSVKAAIARSTEVWLQDLHTLFQRAKDYYPDVLWRVDGGEELGRGSKTEIWGHYAVVYSRASPALREKYFPTGSFLSSSASPARIGFTGARASFSDDFELFYTGRSSGGLSHYEGHESMDIEEDSKNELRKDLLSMWRTRLNSDVRITTTITDDAATSEQESKVAVIHSHRFVLASRSPYFYEQLRQTEQVPGEPTLTLPSPPFTPLFLYSTLRWIYTGEFAFESDQLELEQWDLAAAFSIMRCAMYLHLDALYDEIQARIVEEMMHGLFHAFLPFDEHEKITGGVWGAGGCKCPQCAWRAPRVLEFARKDDVKSVYLDRGARRALTAHFGEGWCTPAFAHLSSKTRRTILKGLAKRMIPSNVFPLLYASQAGMKKLEGVKEPWATVSREMLLAASDAIDKVLCGQSAECFRQREWLEIMEPEDDNVERDEKLEWIVNAIQRGMNDSNAAMLYQIFKQSMLRYPDAGPYVRMRVEETYEEMLLWLQNRWTFVKQEGGFNGLEGWILADILRGIEIDDEELLHVLKQPFAALNNKG